MGSKRKELSGADERGRRECACLGLSSGDVTAHCGEGVLALKALREKNGVYVQYEQQRFEATEMKFCEISSLKKCT